MSRKSLDFFDEDPFLKNKFLSLTPCQNEEFYKEFLDSLYDRTFLETFGFNYSNPDVQKVKYFVFKNYILKISKEG